MTGAYAVRRCFGRLLNHPWLAFLGVLSYSLYLWQQPFLNRLGTSWINAFPVNVLLAMAAGLISYYAVERPLLNLRRRIETWLWPRKLK